jgi:hypothetical protein
MGARCGGMLAEALLALKNAVVSAGVALSLSGSGTMELGPIEALK